MDRWRPTGRSTRRRHSPVSSSQRRTYPRATQVPNRARVVDASSQHWKAVAASLQTAASMPLRAFARQGILERQCVFRRKQPSGDAKGEGFRTSWQRADCPRFLPCQPRQVGQEACRFLGRRSSDHAVVSSAHSSPACLQRDIKALSPSSASNFASSGRFLFRSLLIASSNTSGAASASNGSTSPRASQVCHVAP